MYPPLVRLLNWCSGNGIHIHPNVRVLHEKKNGICVRAANGSITPEQSRKRLGCSLISHNYQAFCFLVAIVPHLPSVSCRNTEIRHPVHPVMCAGRPYPSLALWSRRHPRACFGTLFRAVRLFLYVAF